MRLDRWFRAHFPQVTFAYLNKLARTGQIRLGGARVKTSTRLEAGQELRVPPLAFDARPADAPPAAVSPLTGTERKLFRSMILFEDRDLFVLNKPAGVVTTASDPEGRPTVVELVPRDTASSVGGAADAARGALAEGARAFAGPLTRDETSAAAVVAQAVNAPVLAFTADEIWQHLPGEREGHVLFTTWSGDLDPLPAGGVLSTEGFARLLALREAVAKVLEPMRAGGAIGASLEAEVDLYLDEAMLTMLAPVAGELRFLFLTSELRLHPASAAPAGRANPAPGTRGGGSATHNRHRPMEPTR